MMSSLMNLKKASSDIHESNTESDDETTEDNSAILDKLIVENASCCDEVYFIRQ